jgi:hypothetical protein
VRGSFERGHDDLFNDEYEAEFINTSVGTRDNVNDTFTGESETSLGAISVEIVPPAMDTTVRDTGTSFSWDTSIRLPQKSIGRFEWGDNWGDDWSAGGTSDWGSNWGTNWGGGTIIDFFQPLGEDNEKPTVVKIKSPAEPDVDEYELHGYSYEKGSGMILCRLREK